MITTECDLVDYLAQLELNCLKQILTLEDGKREELDLFTLRQTTEECLKILVFYYIIGAREKNSLICYMLMILVSEGFLMTAIYLL